MATLVNRRIIYYFDNFPPHNIRWNKYSFDILRVNVVEKEGFQRIILKLV
jgi:hypothetical protein